MDRVAEAYNHNKNNQNKMELSIKDITILAHEFGHVMQWKNILEKNLMHEGIVWNELRIDRAAAMVKRDEQMILNMSEPEYVENNLERERLAEKYAQLIKEEILAMREKKHPRSVASVTMDSAADTAAHNFVGYHKDYYTEKSVEHYKKVRARFQEQKKEQDTKPMDKSNSGGHVTGPTENRHPRGARKRTSPASPEKNAEETIEDVEFITIKQMQKNGLFPGKETSPKLDWILNEMKRFDIAIPVNVSL